MDSGLTSRSLREERRARRMSQAELAQRTGMSATIISNYEKGTRKITPEAAVKIKHVFNTLSPVTEKAQQVTKEAELSDEHTVLRWHGKTLQDAESHIIRTLAKLLVEQRK